MQVVLHVTAATGGSAAADASAVSRPLLLAGLDDEGSAGSHDTDEQDLTGARRLVALWGTTSSHSYVRELGPCSGVWASEAW